ncbi:MAG: hypothetical protein KA781_06355 [Aquabacterium sp.]|nr:hypothetical protein [Aquabacterium sp.]
MTPAQLDQHIASLGMALADAHANGDAEGARVKLEEMHAAIRSRTPEHQAAMEAGIQARIEGDAVHVPSTTRSHLNWLRSFVRWAIHHRSISLGKWVADYENAPCKN